MLWNFRFDWSLLLQDKTKGSAKPGCSDVYVTNLEGTVKSCICAVSIFEASQTSTHFMCRYSRPLKIVHTLCVRTFSHARERVKEAEEWGGGGGGGGVDDVMNGSYAIPTHLHDGASV